MSNILVIDDEKSIRKALSEILLAEGYKVEEAVDGLEGYNLIKSKTYDCVLSDIKMPKKRRHGIARPAAEGWH